jgi:hypothetical protein
MPHIRGIELRSDHWNYTVSRPPAILFGEPSLLLIFAASRLSIVATDLIDERSQTEPGAEAPSRKRLAFGYTIRY